ncbi:altered inheritance of mitochondria 32 [Olea europaea subsp. europaea]|uniref:Altered inheritance of mitochondria 32 n=1 Tax=Olea europaea subsp. europaea TaxID=158383 RepID=A0A8S0SD07_OLEEU|nr:altered inheritance of mitochondria 32 [Olea europaea subsp. europaea]
MENGPPPIKRLHETQVFKKSMVKALKNGGQVVLLDLGNLKVQIEETETKHPSLITQVLQQYHSVGGHQYAGNMIIFNADEGKISSNWNGYVTPNDVSELIDQQIGKGEIIERIWRGRVDAHVEKTEKVDAKLENIG